MSKMFRYNNKLNFINLKNANFSNVISYADMFLDVSNNINIIVKDNTQKDWINNKFTNKINIALLVNL